MAALIFTDEDEEVWCANKGEMCDCSAGSKILIGQRTDEDKLDRSKEWSYADSENEGRTQCGEEIYGWGWVRNWYNDMNEIDMPPVYVNYWCFC